jgi:hypothetical protein
MRKSKLFWPSLFVLCLSSCATGYGAIGALSSVSIANDGACAASSVTLVQVKDFFRHAVLVNAQQIHDHFDVGPCSARGTAETRYGSWRWELRAGGSATVTDSNGDAFLLADPRQESSLADE